jgi:hypothetical protein
MFASLLKQLLLHKSELPASVIQLYQKLTSQSMKPQRQDLEQAFISTSQGFDRAYIIIDALDECAKNHRNAMLRGLDMLQKRTCMRMFVTSRPHAEDIKQAFELSPTILIEATSSDLKKYVSSEIENSDDPNSIDEEFKNEIIEVISQKANDMYV